MYKTMIFTSAMAILLGGPSAYAQTFATHIDTSVTGNDWSYTLFNDELAGSPNYASFFDMTVNAPFNVVSSPAGWTYQTDNSTYVLWSNTDAALPYPHDVAPGTSLGGFEISSTVTTSANLSVTIYSWDHSQDAPGPVADGTALVPNSPAPIPEASTFASFGVLLFLGSIGLVARKRALGSA